MNHGRIRTPGSGSLCGKEGRHFLQLGTLKTSVSYQNATPAIWPSLCVVILFCGIVHLKLWFSFISNLHNRPGASFTVHRDRRQAGGHSAHITVAREQRGSMAVLESFLLLSRLFPRCQPHYMAVPTFKAHLPPSFILSGNLYTSVFLSPIKVTCRLFCELSLGNPSKHPCTRDRAQMTDQRKGFSKC